MASRRKLTARQRLVAAVRRLNHMTAAITVGAVGFYASYQHIFTVSTRYGQPHDIAALMPVAVDALMIVAGRYVTHAKSKLGKTYAVAGFMLSSLASLGANILAAPATTPARVVAGWPAVCLILAALIVHYGERKPRRRATPQIARRTAQRGSERPLRAHQTPRVTPVVARPTSLTDVPLPWDAPTSNNRLAPLPR